MTDPRDKRIAELEARVDKLVDAIAKLASERPSVVYPVAPYVPYQPSYPYQPWVWNGNSVWITNVTVSARSEIETMLPRPSPTMTVIG